MITYFLSIIRIRIVAITTEARLLELDGFIEKSTNKKSALPDQLKGTKNLDALHVLIANTDKLLEELKRENAGSSSEP
jgi:hypothetical protein